MSCNCLSVKPQLHGVRKTGKTGHGPGIHSMLPHARRSTPHAPFPLTEKHAARVVPQRILVQGSASSPGMRPGRAHFPGQRAFRLSYGRGNHGGTRRLRHGRSHGRPLQGFPGRCKKHRAPLHVAHERGIRQHRLGHSRSLRGNAGPGAASGRHLPQGAAPLYLRRAGGKEHRVLRPCASAHFLLSRHCPPSGGKAGVRGRGHAPAAPFRPE